MKLPAILTKHALKVYGAATGDSHSGQPLMKPRPVGAKRFLGRAAVATALMAGSLHAGAASALSFNFSFSGAGTPTAPATVTGIVEGLVDNTNGQVTGVTVTITSATNGPTGTVFTDANISDGSGFDVASGQITGANIEYANPLLIVLALGNQGNFVPEYYQFSGFANRDSNNQPSNTLVFTPLSPGPAPVPGPLPILGAGAAFSWSRRLRRRIKATA